MYDTAAHFLHFLNNTKVSFTNNNTSTYELLTNYRLYTRKQLKVIYFLAPLFSMSTPSLLNTKLSFPVNTVAGVEIIKQLLL